LQNPPSQPPAPRWRFWLAYISGAFGLAITTQLNFLVPLRARELGASFELIGIIVGASALAPALLSVTTGAVIDRFGARRTFVLATTATAACAALFVFVTSYWWLLVLQPSVGALRNVGWLAIQSYITGLPAERQLSAVGRFAFFSNIGQMAGPALIGAVAQVAGFRWAFLFLAAYAAAFAVIGLLLPPAAPVPHAPAKHGIGIRSAMEISVLRPVQVVLLLSGARMWISWVYAAFLPIHLVDSGLAPGTVGTVMAAAGVVAALLSPTADRWTRWLSAPSVATVSLACGALGLLLAPYLAVMPWVWLVPALVGVGNGVSLPVLLTLLASAAPPGRRGVAFGLRAAVNQTVAAAGPVMVGAVIAGSGMVLGFTAGAFVAAAILAGARLLASSRPSVEAV
jgi:MFS family permease